VRRDASMLFVEMSRQVGDEEGEPSVQISVEVDRWQKASLCTSVCHGMAKWKRLQRRWGSSCPSNLFYSPVCPRRYHKPCLAGNAFLFFAVERSV